MNRAQLAFPPKCVKSKGKKRYGNYILFSVKSQGGTDKERTNLSRNFEGQTVVAITTPTVAFL